ncbi:methyl-accepting chemotaxis protein [Pseudoxanthomonas japonensis]|uniref:methyl-accepting chemotaxis protein n=1 Tax=Pseudoxanthomonas japonensis TaxID=69284 RepID=UPI002858E88F|nr:methyl-accepting chemotaxis protein [Pseudoxanthomonas japonensis]MDR7069146.1 methyl-accepting chemotaxis protein [Pseudoxanthomonas japonensis]
MTTAAALSPDATPSAFEWGAWAARLVGARPRVSAKEAQRRACLAELQAQVEALHKVQAVIEFDLAGNILTANANFLGALGYTLPEIVGRHHRMFVDGDYAASAEYRDFWARLGRGEFDEGQYRRLGKGGREVWIQASYNPVFDPNGKPYKVIKFATDITRERLQAADYAGQLAAIGKSQAVIEFDLTGTILSANQNFLDAMGYRLEEVQGRHHSMFADAAYRDSTEYRAFWQKLGRGEYDAGQYLRHGKGGREIWIQASYNPIFDASGRPVKVVKYATDVTAQVRATLAMEAALAQSRQVVQAAQSGDLTARVPTRDKDGAVAELCQGINALVEMMGSLVGDIQGAAEVVNAGVRDIAAGNSDLSVRTEQQAASVEETASSVAELSATVRHTADNARMAADLAVGATDVAARGGQVVHGVVDTMSQINASSRRIADIIGVIDGIAFQTNILALNAAVEAARAGEQGRGFAVVASEVRSLAQRCGGAAREIKQLIGDSLARVEEGSRQVEHAGANMEEIVASVVRVSTLIGQISLASQEQSLALDQVNQTITHIDHNTQQNAALVEEASAAAHSLQDQAAQLLEAVERFHA